MFNGVNVSMRVMSQTRDFPLALGNKVMPSVYCRRHDQVQLDRVALECRLIEENDGYSSIVYTSIVYSR